MIDYIKGNNKTFENKINIKLAGPPRPFLNLRQECKSKNKALTRNTMSQDRLNALSVLSIEKKCIQTIPDFNKKVIEHFALEKCRRIDLLFIYYFST